MNKIFLILIVFYGTVSLTIAWFGRDFGPMLKAERRALKTGQVLAPGATPLSSLDAQEIVADEKIKKNGIMDSSLFLW